MATLHADQAHNNAAMEPPEGSVSPARKARLHIGSLQDIVDLDQLQAVQDAFAQATGLASTITDIHGDPLTRPSNHCEVCKIIRSTPKGMKNCIRSGRILGKRSSELMKPYHHACHSIGFVDASAPIVVEGHHIANWLIGQNYIGNVDEQRVGEYAREIETDPERLIEAFRVMPKMSREDFEKELYFLWLIASLISRLGYESLKHAQTIVELRHYKANLEAMVKERTDELEQAIQEIEAMSVKDALTGCFNRGYLMEKLPAEIKRARRYRHPLAVVMVDIDHFKAINDTHGHVCGDQVLTAFVRVMQENLRQNVDWLARYGGEEFILILPDTDMKGAEITAERTRKAIQKADFSCDTRALTLTASFGISAYEPEGYGDAVEAQTLINSSDTYLYQAKEAGRNRVISGPLES